MEPVFHIKFCTLDLHLDDDIGLHHVGSQDSDLHSISDAQVQCGGTSGQHCIGLQVLEGVEFMLHNGAQVLLWVSQETMSKKEGY